MLEFHPMCYIQNMPYTTTSYQIGPEFTPVSIRRLILITCITTILSALFNPLFPYFFNVPGPQEWLSLSWSGMRNFFLWEPVSYLFVQYTSYEGISIFFLLSLIVNMYILWVMGSVVENRIGSNAFLKLYFGSGIVTGLLTLAVMYLTGQHTILSSPAPCIMAVLMIWTMMHPENELLIFLLFPVRAKWLMVGILSMVVLVNLSRLNLADMAFYLLGALYGYVYAVTVWDMEGPFSFLKPIDHALSKLAFFTLKRTEQPSEGSKSQSKIIDFHTGDPLVNDEEFVDEMLTKISERGEKSLTNKERIRLKKISERKSRHMKK